MPLSDYEIQLHQAEEHIRQALYALDDAANMAPDVATGLRTVTLKRSLQSAMDAFERHYRYVKDKPKAEPTPAQRYVLEQFQVGAPYGWVVQAEYGPRERDAAMADLATRDSNWRVAVREGDKLVHAYDYEAPKAGRKRSRARSAPLQFRRVAHRAGYDVLCEGRHLGYVEKTKGRWLAAPPHRDWLPLRARTRIEAAEALAAASE